MDFTSDLVESKASSVVADGSSSDIDMESPGHSGVPAEELRRLELEEQKEKLLKQRNLLLKQVDTTEKEVNELRKSRVTVDGNAMDTLIDVLSLSRRRKEEEEAKRLSSRVPSSTAKLNGWSSVQEELNNKYDSLPLLNMDLRLKYLWQLYKGVDVRLLDGTTYKGQTAPGRDPTEVVINAQFRFGRFEANPFEVLVCIKYDEVDQTLKEFVIKDVSKEVAMQLQPLNAVRNPSFFFTACFEFDKIRQRRFEILNGLASKYRKRVSRCELPRSGEYALFETLDVMKDRKVSLRIDFHIVFETKKLGYSPYPSSRITCDIRKNNHRVLANEIDIIASGLVREYGVQRGLEELLNVCLFADLYK